MRKKPGDWVEPGDVLAVLYTCDEKTAARVVPLVSNAFILGEQPLDPGPFILGVVNCDREEIYV
jgi:thymidine phosphorylase